MYERLPLLLMKKIAKTDEEREHINSIDLEIKKKSFEITSCSIFDG